MASVTRRALPRGCCCCLAVVLALAVVVASGEAAAEEDESSGGPNWHVVSVASLLPSAVCTPNKRAAAASNSSALISVVHRHGPCSPLQARGGEPSHAEILDRDQHRVDWIHRLTAGPSMASTSKGVTLPARRGVPLGTANYIVSVGLGTPRRDLLVVFDTGSDLSWVQCKPCKNCYQQHDPLFDPSQSKTYSAVPCGAPECRRLNSGSCTSGKCRYEVVYGDMSQTDGNLARDTLTLGASSADQLQGFVFGCGDDNTGLFGRADGLFGLGRDRVSLASQAAAKYGAGFSYCLPSSNNAEGYLSLGSATPRNAQFTAMVTRSDTPSFYYLNLIGIRVAGRAIGVSPSVFRTPGTVIDSGTVVTRLPSRAYAALRSSFARLMLRLNYKRAPALSILDTCYDFTGRAGKVRIPSVALLFDGGATLDLAFGGVLYVANISQACLAFASNGDDTSIGILGNMQQKTFAVVYDVANQKIGFGAKGCS